MPPHATRACVLVGAALVGLIRVSAQASDPASPWQTLDLHGFADLRSGVRTQSDPTQNAEIMQEARLQLEAQRFIGPATAQWRADILYDEVLHEKDLDLEQGQGWLDLRELNLQFSPLNWADIKMGRQILTWGTGDLIFINDMFPKDYQAFFMGRDEAYLKAPSDALFASLFHPWANLDIAYTPRFDADRFISGERISYFSPSTGTRAGRNMIVDPERPEDWLNDDELALRLSRNLNGIEYAAYAYNGFWKSPRGFNPESGRATFPALRTAGASVRGQLAKGIGHMELGYFDSLDDRHGDDPSIPNSEARFLMGYDREVARNLTGGLQYYAEHLQDYGALKRSLPEGQAAPDATRHVLTLRLTKMLWDQNLVLSLFSFFSPSDEDAYLRPTVSYKASDNWLLTAGGNVFLGAHQETFFGQFEDNSNVYAGARYSF